eukprot:gene17025-8530_t
MGTLWWKPVLDTQAMKRNPDIRGFRTKTRNCWKTCKRRNPRRSACSMVNFKKGRSAGSFLVSCSHGGEVWEHGDASLHVFDGLIKKGTYKMRATDKRHKSGAPIKEQEFKAQQGHKALRTAMAHVKSAITVAQGLGHLDSEHAYDLKPKGYISLNKKSDIQPRFIKEKGYKKPQNSLSFPMTEQRKAVKMKLLDQLTGYLGLTMLDPDCLLPLEACDLLSYVVLETSFYTNKQFKAYSHWVCVSSIGYQNDEIKIYDSLYNNVISNEVEQQIECMLGGAPFRMMVASVQQPQNGSNCGIFAIAFAT